MTDAHPGEVDLDFPREWVEFYDPDNPEHLIAAVPAETWSPLLGHEIAHAARRDYLANLVQSACDVLLVTCPGAW